MLPVCFELWEGYVSRSWHLGNDIVDLVDRRHAGKAGDQRFLERVFTLEEQRTIRASQDPDHTLWILWASKEAAFKTISKSMGTPPTFNHPLFQVTVFGSLDSEGTSKLRLEPPKGETPAIEHRGEVRYGETLVPVHIEVNGSSLHALSWLADSSGHTPTHRWGWEELTEEEADWRALNESRFSSVEWQCISHRASAMARLAAKRALATSLGTSEDDLEIGCDPGVPGRRIPRVFLKGQPLEVDLSLSHHGRLLAWAFVVD